MVELRSVPMDDLTQILASPLMHTLSSSCLLIACSSPCGTHCARIFLLKEQILLVSPTSSKAIPHDRHTKERQPRTEPTLLAASITLLLARHVPPVQMTKAAAVLLAEPRMGMRKKARMSALPTAA